MEKTTTLSWVILILFTLASALFSEVQEKYVVLIVLLLATMKFNIIAFQFMEMKKAHVFWKNMVLGFSIFFIVLLLAI